MFLALILGQQAIDISCCRNRFTSTTEIKFELFTWISLCISIDLENQIYSLVYNGNAVEVKDSSVVGESSEGDELLTTSSIQVEGEGILLLGQDQYSYDGHFNPYRSLQAELSDLFVVNGVLDINQMIRITTCKQDIPVGDILVSFEDVENDFSFQNVSLDTINPNLFCNQTTYFYRIFHHVDERKNFEDTKLFCRSLGGDLTIPKSLEENMKLFNLTRKSKLCELDDTFYNDALWIAAKVSTTNKSWVNTRNGQDLEFKNFAETERQPKEQYRCASFYSCPSGSSLWYAKWYMRKCAARRKSLCIFESLPIFHLRGLPKSSVFDRKYFLSPIETERKEFLGLFYTKIIPSATNNGTTDIWRIERTDIPKVSAEMQRFSMIDYPTGLNVWKVKKGQQESQLTLKLTICKEGQFSCNDRSCIDINSR